VSYGFAAFDFDPRGTPPATLDGATTVFGNLKFSFGPGAGRLPAGPEVALRTATVELATEYEQRHATGFAAPTL